MMARSTRLIASAILLGLAPFGAQAQQKSDSYKFLEAVRGEKADEVQKMLGTPGSTVINTREVSSGEGALHIVVKRNDAVYLRFLLQQGANANIRDNKGNTPLFLAASAGAADLVDILIAANANINLANSSGETPLIRAVQRRDLVLVRTLLAAGADPDQADLLAGMSAREYARDDSRSPALTKMLADAPKRVKQTGVAGPGL